MAGFLYFSEQKVQGESALELLSLCGMGGIIEKGVGFECRGCQGGPSGKPGTTFQHQDEVDELGYFAERQSWQAIPGTPLWIGWRNDNRPCASDLRKKGGLPGLEVALRPGENWLCPQGREVRNMGEGFRLTFQQEAEFNHETREWELGTVVEEYQELYRIMAEWGNARADGAFGANLNLADDEVGYFSFADLMGSAVRVLSTHYRVSNVEVNTLGLFKDTNNAKKVLDALLDLHGLEQIKKKLEAATSNT